jgi:nitroreductase
MSLFEAARWAPSSFNNQPWRFIYAKRNTQHWDRLFNLLHEANQAWPKDAAVLVSVISRKNFEYDERPSITHHRNWIPQTSLVMCQGLLTAAPAYISLNNSYKLKTYQYE